MSDSPPDAALPEGRPLSRWERAVYLWTPLLLILTVTAAVYAPTLRAGFVFDDEDLIVKNESFLKGEGVAEYASKHRLRQELMRSYKRDLRLSGGEEPDPAIFHAANVLTHLLVVALVYGLLLLGAPRAGFEERLRIPFAVLAAMIVALHPIQSEAVAYVTGRADLLATWYTLLALALFFVPLAWCHESDPLTLRSDYARERALPARRFALLAGACWLACLALFAKGLLCKEVAAVLPLLVVLVAVYLPGRLSPWRPAAVAVMGLFFVGVIALLAIRILAFGTLGNPDFQLPLFVTIATNLWALLRYVLIWFLPGGQSADHFLPIIASIFTVPALLGLSALALLVLAILYWHSRAPEIALGLTWFLVGLLPTNSVIALPDAFVERRLYLSSIGMAVAVAGGLLRLRARVAQSGRWRRWVPGVKSAVALGALMALLSSLRAGVWLHELTLWADAANSRERVKPRVYYNLGTALLKAGEAEGALNAFSQLFRFNQKDVRAHLNVGNAFLQAGWMEQALWVFKNNVLSIDPDNAEARYNLAVIYEQRGEIGTAEDYLKEAVHLDPNMEQAYVKLGTYAFTRGEPVVALEDFNKAVALDPQDPIPRRFLVLLYSEMMEDLGAAAPHIEALTRIDEKNVENWFALAVLRDRQGEVLEARDLYEKLIRMAPGHVGAHINLGALYQRQGNLVQACQLLRRGASLDPSYTSYSEGVCAQQGPRP